jgi:hypothetical protein
VTVGRDRATGDNALRDIDNLIDEVFIHDTSESLCSTT